MEREKKVFPGKQVWPPDGDHCQTDFDVIFFHGFQFGDEADQMWRTTWFSRGDPPTCWPEEWLPLDLGHNVRILLLSYDAHATKSHGFGNTGDVSEIAKKLVESIVTSKWKLGQEHPFVLVGHSFGGIVIKSFVVEVDRRSKQTGHLNDLEIKVVEGAKAFMKNLAGVAFYATPHAGSQHLMNYVTQYGQQNEGKWKWKWKWKSQDFAGIVNNVNPSHPKTAHLSNDFDAVQRSRNTIVCGFFEGKHTENVEMMVEPGSAQIPGCSVSYKLEGYDHFEVCKPFEKQDPSYSLLLDFLQVCRKDFLRRHARIRASRLPVIGLSENLVNLKKAIQSKNVVAVVGMGGIGKTTLVKHLYDEIHGEFQSSSFLNSSNKSNIEDLQKKLIDDLFGFKLECSQEYVTHVVDCCINKKVLVVIDDANKEQVSELLCTYAINFDIGTSGSKVILTGHNWEDFEDVVHEQGRVEMELLNFDSAMELFSRKAFLESRAQSGFQEIAKEVVTACRGLPLSLEVMGSWLKTKDTLILWEEALSRLKLAQPLGVVLMTYQMKNMKCSYDCHQPVPEDASDGYQSELEGPLDTEFMTANIQALTKRSLRSSHDLKEKTLAAIRDLNDRTMGHNSKLQVNVLQCKYMVATILASNLMSETCPTWAEPMYKELFRIVKKAESIMQECSDEPGKLKPLLAQMNNVHAFAAVVVDWLWCTRSLKKDEDCTWESDVHLKFEKLRGQDLSKNKQFWDTHIAELQQQPMSSAGDSKTGEKIKLADYLRGRVQNVMNANNPQDEPLPTSDLEVQRGNFLGHGSFGSVCECTWFGMVCAEKSFNPFPSEKQERDFANEVGVMVSLNHPHIVQFICCRRVSSNFSIVMEIMPTNLEMYIRKRKVSHNPFTHQAAVDIMLQIASGMEYLHGQNVVHRDLKPNNILVCPITNPELSADGYVEVKLADFGFAKTKVNTSASMLQSQICGAAPWRAPEAFGHQSRFSAKRADVYSFAIMCSQILSGNLHPFGDPPMRVHERISSPQCERPCLPSNNNDLAQLLSLIEECWAPKPMDRPKFSNICRRLKEIRQGLLLCKET